MDIRIAFDAFDRPAPPPVAARRILIVMQDFAGGGTERVAVRLANGWARAGRTVRIFCGSEAGPLRAQVGPGVEVVEATPARSRTLLSRVMLGRALVDATIDFRPDILFAPGNFHILLLAIFHGIAGEGAVPTLCKLSNPLALSGPAWLARLHRGLLRRLTGSITGLTAMSPSLLEEAAAFLGRRDLHLAHDPIALPPYRPASAGYRRRGGLRILCAGRLEPQKNFALALHAFARLPANLGAELTILGEGRDRRRLSRLAKRLGIADRVTMPGHAATIGAALAQSDVLLCTSRFEGYPAVPVEALAAGVPVVTTRCSVAIAQLAGEGQAMSVTDATAGALAAALLRVAAGAMPAAPDAAARLRERHGERTVADYLAVMDGIVNASAKARLVSSEHALLAAGGRSF